MRKLTDNDLVNITRSVIEGYKVEAVRVKRGEFIDSDHYGIILGKNAGGNYVTWQFHLDENESVNPYWGHYFNENREAALRDYDTRDLGIDKGDVWSKYLRYLRGWTEAHSDSGFYGMPPTCFDEWFSSEYREIEADGQEGGLRNYKVTITETLKMTVDIEAESSNEAEQIASDNWRNSEYVLDSDNFVGVEFEAVPKEADTVKDEGYQCCLHDTPRTLDWCENNCDRYYSCDTVAQAIDELKD